MDIQFNERFRTFTAYFPYSEKNINRGGHGTRFLKQQNVTDTENYDGNQIGKGLTRCILVGNVQIETFSDMAHLYNGKQIKIKLKQLRHVISVWKNK